MANTAHLSLAADIARVLKEAQEVEDDPPPAFDETDEHLKLLAKQLRVIRLLLIGTMVLQGVATLLVLWRVG